MTEHKTEAVEVEALRAIGFTEHALFHPRDDLAFLMICAFCNYEPDKAPWGMRFFPNASVKAAWDRVAAVALAAAPAPAVPQGHVEIAHDGFAGDIIGSYITREGKRGVVVQQDGTRVVHVYGAKWIEGQVTAPAHPDDELTKLRARVEELEGAALHHETGERITRKDLNNAFRQGQENGRAFAVLFDGGPDFLTGARSTLGGET